MLRSLSAVIVSAIAAVFAVPATSPADAAVFPCPDVEVIFARGSAEPPGMGDTGNVFFGTLRDRLSPLVVEPYAVGYDSSGTFAASAGGITDFRSRITDVAWSCPATRIVVGGFSRGATLLDFALSDAVPPPVSGWFDAPPLMPDLPPRVSATVFLGHPNARYMRDDLGVPYPPHNSAYVDREVWVCVPDDVVCADGGSSVEAHQSYAVNGAAVATADRVAAMLSG